MLLACSPSCILCPVVELVLRGYCPIIDTRNLSFLFGSYETTIERMATNKSLIWTKEDFQFMMYAISYVQLQSNLSHAFT